MNNHIIIAGGTRGIGRTCAELLQNIGCQCHIISRTQPEEDKIVNGATYYRADLTNQDSLRKAIQNITSLGIKLQGVALFQRHRGKEESWEGNISSTLFGTRNLIETAIPHFSLTGDKSIVIISSIASRFVADEQDEGYHAVKAGVVGMSRYYAYKLGPLGIRVNCVAPGTLLKEESKHFFTDNQELYDLYKSVTPLRRMGTAEEVAKAVQFLLSNASSFITGQELVVDGGAGLQWQESLARSLKKI